MTVVSIEFVTVEGAIKTKGPCLCDWVTEILVTAVTAEGEVRGEAERVVEVLDTRKALN